MTDLLSEKTPKARKEYYCQASEWITNSCELADFTFSERKTVVKAYRNKWRIQKGDKYIYQALVCCGDFFTFRAIPELHDICIKYDIYEDC